MTAEADAQADVVGSIGQGVLPAEVVAEMQERTRAATATGEHHERLAWFIGTWDVEIALVMPGVPRKSWKATATTDWLIDGRWLGERIEGTLFDAPFQSFSIRGFDTYAKNHVAGTVSSTDNSFNLVRGPVVDPSHQVTALYGTLDEYTTGELGKPFKVVTRIEGDDRFTLEIWDFGIGADGAMVLEYDYRRRRD